MRRGGPWHAAPFAVCIGAIVALQYVPFTRIWLDANFWLLRTERERIVAEIERGSSSPTSRTMPR